MRAGVERFMEQTAVKNTELRTARTIEDYNLVCVDGEIGKIKEFYFDDVHWAIRYLVVNSGNWLTGRQVLISPYAITEILDDLKQIKLNLTKKQIEDSPSVDTDRPVSRQFESEYTGYFGYPAYWMGTSVWGGSMYPGFGVGLNSQVQPEMRLNPDESQVERDSHLRSSLAVTGHRLHATDGEIGHVKDFVIQDKTWIVRYFVVDISKWFSGKQILISPSWVKSIGWEEHEIFVDMTLDQIKKSPPFDGAGSLTRGYETELHSYYDRFGYWSDDGGHVNNIY